MSLEPLRRAFFLCKECGAMYMGMPDDALEDMDKREPFPCGHKKGIAVFDGRMILDAFESDSMLTWLEHQQDGSVAQRLGIFNFAQP